MCGILGIAEKNENVVRDAARLMAHRGPDAVGVLEDVQVTLGHNRLSIIDLDERANQPMQYEEGALVISYNGEIYNYKQIRTDLTALGHTFRTESDTEVLLAAYREWGQGLTARVAGMFAFAILDRARNTLVLATDHANMKPLFYAQVGEVFVFASELRAVVRMLKEKQVPVVLDQESLELYFALGYVPAPRTLYTGIRRLPKRAWMEYDLQTHTVTESQYSERTAAPMSEEKVHALIEERILSHLVADVPVGVFFSGGTDSSLILSVLHKHNIELETFSVKVAGRPGDDRYFNAIANHLGVKAHTYEFGVAEFEASYKEVSKKIDEPIYDNSLYPTYFVAQKAAEKVKVVLSGEGGDEYFFGYPRSLALLPFADQPLERGVGGLERLFFMLPHFRGKNKLFEQLFLLLRKPAAYYLLTMSPGKSVLTWTAWKRAKASILEAVANTRALDADMYLPNNLLRKLDMATMYCSIEGRVPLLDPDVGAAARALPPPAKGEEKPVLRRMLAQYLPKGLVYRKKQGFGLSVQQLFKDSTLLQSDLERACEYLKSQRLPVRLPQAQALMQQYPHLAFAVLALYHALYNVEHLS